MKRKIHLSVDVVFPEKTKVYVVVPDFVQNVGGTKFNLNDMISRMPPIYKAREDSFGDPVGKEEW